MGQWALSRLTRSTFVTSHEATLFRQAQALQQTRAPLAAAQSLALQRTPHVRQSL